MSKTALAHPRTRWRVTAMFGIAGSLFVALLVLAFLWPTKTMGAHHLPVGIAGPDAAITAVQAAVGTHGLDAVDFVTAVDRDNAITQIQTRQTYGAIVLSETGAAEVLTASAGSAAATQMLSGIAAQLQAQLTAQAATTGGTVSAVNVTEVVPLAQSDPSGAGLTAASFPMMFGGMIGGILVSMVVVGPFRRMAALGGFAVMTGILITLLLQTWFGFLQGDFWMNALALGVSVLATSAFIVGCAALLGRTGIGIGAVVTMLFANPIAAASVPWQFLAEPWGAMGQFFVPGASNWLLRSLSYFPSADDAKQWWILAGWIALGIVLMVIGRFRDRAMIEVPEATLDPATVTAG